MKVHVLVHLQSALQAAQVAPPAVDTLVYSAWFSPTNTASIVHPRPTTLQSYKLLQKSVCLRNEIAKRLVLCNGIQQAVTMICNVI